VVNQVAAARVAAAVNKVAAAAQQSS